MSGHISLTKEEFDLHYKERIDEAIRLNHSFVVGNAKGADTMALEHVLKSGVDPKNVTVYVYDRYNPERTLEKYRRMGVNVKHNTVSYTNRDAEMTTNSDYDVLWVRPLEDNVRLYGSEFDPNKKSGTQRNLERRTKLSTR